MVDRSVVDAVRTYFRALGVQGLPVSFGVVLGSQVRDVRERWSDIDVVVVSSRYDGTRSRRDVDLHSGSLAARKMGGFLWAESPGEGLGATFILELQASSPAQASAASAA